VSGRLGLRRSAEPRTPGQAAPTSGERGAAALEFALVLPLLLLLVFGGMDYGFYINDSMVLRDAARGAARSAVVGTFASQDGCGGLATPLGEVACSTRAGADGATGEAGVRVFAPRGFVPGQPLVVCAELTERAGIGFVPLPGGGTVRVRVEFAIEASAGTVDATGGTVGGGVSGTWCDA
jgi:TadE-like protein